MCQSKHVDFIAIFFMAQKFHIDASLILIVLDVWYLLHSLLNYLAFPLLLQTRLS